MDKLSVQRIALLHPMLRDEALLILGEIEKVLTGRATVRFTYTLRSAEEQNGLYALGRTKKNPDGVSKARPLGYKVTNAPAWSSMHNYGLALDIALILDGKEASWNDVKDFDGDGIADWMECVAIFKKHGWIWGGDWSSIVDKPHFQKTFGLTLKQLQVKRISGDFMTGTPYVNIEKIKRNELTTTADVNIRAGAGTQFDIIRGLPKGSKVILLSEDRDWRFVEFGKLHGWVNQKYLQK